MPRPELGTKRVCPTTGRRFYDLGRDPVISPYTGEVVPILAASYPKAFAPVAARKSAATEEEGDEEGTELVSLTDVEAAEGADEKDTALDSDDVLEVEDTESSDDGDTLIEDDEEGDDATDLIDVEKDEDE